MEELYTNYEDLIIGISFLIIFHLAAYLILTLEITSRRNQKELDELMDSDTQRLSEVYKHNWKKRND